MLQGSVQLDNSTGTVTGKPRTINWNDNYHVMYVDQPVGVGWSHKGKDTNVSNTSEAGEDFNKFITEFFKNINYTKLKGYDLYLTGESFSGSYVPVFAEMLIKNKT